jgi:CSLREA domain-containing protein
MVRLAPLVAAAASIALLTAPPAARANDIKVTTTGDTVAADGLCSLREAITAAAINTAFDGCTTGSGADNVVLGSGHFTLSRTGPGEDGNNVGDLDLAGPVDLTGAGAGSTTIDAGGFTPALPDRAIEVRPGATVVLRGVTVTGGHAPDGASSLTKNGLPGNPGETVVGTAGGVGSDGGGILNRGTLTLENVTVLANRAGDGGRGGDANGGSGGSCACDAGSGFGGPGGDGGNGGGVANFGTLTVTMSRVTINVAGSGGLGGAASGGPGGVVGNNAGHGGDGNGGIGGLGGWGGGIFNAATLTVESSSVLGNDAGVGGGGSAGHGGGGGISPVFTAASGLGDGGSGNQGGFGGGIAASPNVVNPSTSISDSALAGNASGSGGIGSEGTGGGSTGNSFGGSGGDSGYGGALVFRGNGDSVSNSTITGNMTGAGGSPGFAVGTASGSTTAGHDGVGRDGFALASFGLGALLLQDTVFANGPQPGEIELPNVGHTTIYLIAGSATITNSIIAGECAENGAAPLNDGGHNLAAGATGCPGSPGDAKLAALADNGGPTPTMALAPGSDAVDKVPVTGAGCPPADQRGVARPQFSACDIGAFELTPAPPGGGGGGNVSPTVGHVSVSPRSFAVGPKPTPLAARRRRVPRGTTIEFQLSEAAQAKLTFQRRLAGIKLRDKRGKRVCVAASKRNRRALRAQVKTRLGAKARGRAGHGRVKRELRKARCARFAGKAALSRAAVLGTNHVAFSGRVGRKALRRGSYRVRVTASDAAGNRSRPASAAFTIVAP